MDAIMVSVIVPVYNAERYLVRCVESILRQRYKDFELILVDDGSDDRSGIICDFYAKNDNRVRVIHKKNGGVSDARNVGIDAAIGKYISFIDSDDWVREDFLLELANAAIDNDVELAICTPEYRALKASHRHCGLKGVLDFTELKLDEYLRFFNHTIGGISCGKLFLAEIIKNNIRFDKNIKIAEDTLFLMDYMFYGRKICILEESMYYYNTFRDSSSRMKLYDIFFDWNLIICERFERLVDTLSVSADDRKKLISQIVLARFIANIAMGVECDNKESIITNLKRNYSKFNKWIFLDTTWKDIHDNLQPIRRAIYEKNIESIYIEQKKIMNKGILKKLIRKLLFKLFMPIIERKRDELNLKPETILG